MVAAGQSRAIGERQVYPIGLGGVNWSFPEQSSDRQSIRTIHAALDVGVSLIDTALAYTTPTHESHNEALIAEALRTYPDREDVVVATKGGHFRAGLDDFPISGRPGAIRKHCELSLRSLGVDCIDLYQLHWPDPSVPIDETMGAFADLQSEGKVQMVGVCNVDLPQLRQAESTVSIVSVQNRFSPLDNDGRAVLDYCADKGIAFIPWSPLGGMRAAQGLETALPSFAHVARQRGVSVHRVVLAWHLAQAPVVIPIPGARKPESISDAAAATGMRLTDEEMHSLSGGVASDGS